VVNVEGVHDLSGNGWYVYRKWILQLTTIGNEDEKNGQNLNKK